MSLVSTWDVLQNPIIFFLVHNLITYLSQKKVVNNCLQEKKFNGGIHYLGSIKILCHDIINNFLSQYLGSYIEGISFVMEFFVMIHCISLNSVKISYIASPSSCVIIMSRMTCSKPLIIGFIISIITSCYMYFIL